MIKATTTTASVEKEEVKPKVRTKKTVENFDLTVCAYCQKDLKAFVANNGLRFCSDDHVSQYLNS